MDPKKYVCTVDGISRGGMSVRIKNYLVPNMNLSDWISLTFSIEDKELMKKVADIQISVESQQFSKKIVPYVASSMEDPLLAKNFFRTFRQSPFRLVFFTTLSFLEKKGVHSFSSDNGLGYSGVAHLRQVRQRIITHKRRMGMYEAFTHQFGEFPRISISELDKVLATNTVVPKRLLPSESILRSVRAKSYAHLKLKKLGKAKYKEMRKAKLARK